MGWGRSVRCRRICFAAVSRLSKEKDLASKRMSSTPMVRGARIDYSVARHEHLLLKNQPYSSVAPAGHCGQFGFSTSNTHILLGEDPSVSAKSESDAKERTSP